MGSVKLLNWIKAAELHHLVISRNASGLEAVEPLTAFGALGANSVTFAR
jgi:hypothetical protein